MTKQNQPLSEQKSVSPTDFSSLLEKSLRVPAISSADLLDVKIEKNGKAGHKHYEAVGEVSAHEFLQKLKEKGYFTTADPSSEGGLIRSQKDGKVVGFFRHPFFRVVKNSPSLAVSDIIPVFTEKEQASSDVSLKKPELTTAGEEIELYVFDLKNYDLAPVMDTDHPVSQAITKHMASGLQKGYYNTYELLRGMIEVDSPPGLISDSRVDEERVGLLREVLTICDRNGLSLYPGSTLPHRGITKDDVNRHPYLQRMIIFLAWERVFAFTCAGVHSHIRQLNEESALKMGNLLPFLMPVMLAPTLAGPFLLGTATPDLGNYFSIVLGLHEDRLKSETYAYTKQPGEWHSFRYLNMFMGSPSGGMLRRPYPETLEEFYKAVEQQLKKGESPTIARLAGQHAVERSRFDMGTWENLVYDMGGAKLPLLTAIKNMNAMTLWKLMYYADAGKLDVLEKDYPEFFGMKPSPQAYEVAHWNMLAVCKEGTNVTITGMDGKEYPVRELWEKFKKFLQQPVEDTANGISYRGMPYKMVDVLDNACQPANWKQFTDNGKPSLDAYYNDEATGTYSEWLLALYRYWREQGQSEKEAIWACVKEACESFRKHVNSYSPDAITKLYGA